MKQWWLQKSYIGLIFIMLSTSGCLEVPTGRPTDTDLGDNQSQINPHNDVNNPPTDLGDNLPPIVPTIDSENNTVSTSDIQRIRLVWTQNPQQEMMIIWDSTDSNLAPSEHLVYYGKQMQGTNISQYSYSQNAFENGAYPNDINVDSKMSEPNFINEWPSLKQAAHLAHRTDFTFHKVLLRNLEPNTRYYFTVRSGNKRSIEFYFLTAPLDNRNIRILALGNSRGDHSGRIRMNSVVKQLITSKYPDILAISHGGNYIDHRGMWNDWKEWLNEYSTTFTIGKRLIPIIPLQGSYESYDHFFPAIFGNPGYSKFRLGKSVIFNLNSQLNYTDQANWIENEMKRSESQQQWRLAFYSGSAYPAMNNPTQALQYWVPLFEKYEFDLAFETDGEGFKKTIPIKNGAYDSNGVIYMGEGGMGISPKVATHRTEWYLNPSQGGMVNNRLHLLAINIGTTALSVETYLDEDISVPYNRHTLIPKRRTIIPDGSVPTTPPTVPTTPPTIPPTTPPSSDPCSNVKVQFFADANYQNLMFELPIGSHDFPEQYRNQLSSLKILNATNTEVTIEMFDKPGLSDLEETVTRDTPSFGYFIDNDIESVRTSCQRIGGTTTPPPTSNSCGGKMVRFYADRDYQTLMFALAPGRYDFNPEWRNKLSSIQFDSGANMTVKLYDKPRLIDLEETVTASTSSLSFFVNDDIESVEIICNDAPVGTVPATDPCQGLVVQFFEKSGYVNLISSVTIPRKDQEVRYVFPTEYLNDLSSLKVPSGSNFLITVELYDDTEFTDLETTVNTDAFSLSWPFIDNDAEAAIIKCKVR